MYFHHSKICMVSFVKFLVHLYQNVPISIKNIHVYQNAYIMYIMYMKIMLFIYLY